MDVAGDNAGSVESFPAAGGLSMLLADWMVNHKKVQCLWREKGLVLYAAVRQARWTPATQSSGMAFYTRSFARPGIGDQEGRSRRR